jgi:hypothetical protein
MKIQKTTQHCQGLNQMISNYEKLLKINVNYGFKTIVKILKNDSSYNL